MRKRQGGDGDEASQIAVLKRLESACLKRSGFDGDPVIM